jgi:SAM-dependent methyltransferase
MMNPSRIMQMASAFQESCLLFAASDLGIFKQLSTSPATADELSQALGLNPRGARLLLDACTAIRLLQKEGEHYSNSAEAAAFLVPGQPSDLSNALRYNRDVYQAWGKVAQLARSGAPVENPELHLGEDPARTRAFVMSMHGKALAMAQQTLSAIDVTGRKQLLDVGGGPGTISALLTKTNPDLVCTVLELAPIVAIAQGLLGGNDRVKLLAGDYHSTPFPGGNDVILLFGMMHQEPVSTIQDLLRRSYESLVPGGVVYVMDMMTDATHAHPPFSAMFAVNMALTKENGWVFSDEELRGWMKEAGFQDFTVKPLPPPAPHWMASARKP